MIKISSPDANVPNKVSRVLEGTRVYKNPNNYTYSISNAEAKKHSSIQCNHYEKLKGLYAPQKTFPMSILSTWNRNSVLAFLAGLIDTDGSVTLYGGKYLTLSFSSTSKELADTYAHLMYTVFQVAPRLHVDSREGRRPCYDYRYGDNFTVNRILKELDHHLVSPSKKFKPEYASLKFDSKDPMTVGVVAGSTREVETYDLHIDNETNLYVLHNHGLVTHNSGKTFLALELAANAQAMGGIVNHNDGERALSAKHVKTAGVDLNSGTFIYTKINDMDKYFAWAWKFVSSVRAKEKDISKPVLLMHDSFPSWQCSVDIDNMEKGKSPRGYMAMQKNAKFSQHIEKFVDVLDKQAATFVLLNQIRKDNEASSSFMKVYNSLCEDVIMFWSTQRIRGLIKKKVTKDVKSDEKSSGKVKSKTGSVVEWEAIKNRFVKPGQKVLVKISYALGIGKYSGIGELLVNDGLVTTGTTTVDHKTGEKLKKAKKTYKVNVDGEEVVYPSIRHCLKAHPEFLEPVWIGDYEDESEDLDDYEDLEDDIAELENVTDEDENEDD